MGDYNLSALSTREFEHLIQALATRVIAPGVTPFGDGPDGGREATFHGRAQYPVLTDPWDGYIVVQCKFRQRPLGADNDGSWALKQLRTELKKYTETNRKTVTPEYYLFVTNVVLSAVEGKGRKDQAFGIVKAVASKIELKGYDIWDYDAICRHLDAHPEVRRSYAALITSHDVMAELLTHLPHVVHRPELEQTLTLFLQREMRGAQYVRLEQAGLSAEQRTPLARVFVDLPLANASTGDDETFKGGIVAAILNAGNAVLRPSLQPELPDATVGELVPIRRSGRAVVVGGPGQGKSTAAQFVCQLYRAALLRDRPRYMLNQDTIATLEMIEEQCTAENIQGPLHRRFPIHIVLERFAAALARGETRSVIGFIATHISHATDRSVTPEELRGWLSAASWIVVLDGLDEVPATSNRAEVLEHVALFRDELATLDADVQIVATTRPQGYSNEFSPSQFEHFHLGPLLPKRALHYAQRLMAVRHSADRARGREVMDRLQRALAEHATARLMQTPLQVTLMATLVEQIGEPPRERWRLFHQYYGAVYAREIERNIASSRLLQGRRADVDAIHHRVGLLVQTEGERPSTTGEVARLSGQRFGRLVRDRLEENGAEDEELESLAEQIEKAATERLVFLVQPEEDRVGFEIRSLQEFAAAEALLTGREVHVRARLAAIAPIPYWRNVFLFAAGRCFADAQYQHFREDILEICDDLNDAAPDGLTAAILEGSRLALDILRDGVAREQPRYARWLAERALKILGSFEVGGPLAALAETYEPPLRGVFTEALHLRLDLERFDQRLPALVLLVRLADKGVDWAVKLADERWPTELSRQHAILAAIQQESWGSWTLTKLLDYVPHARLQDLDALQWPEQPELKLPAIETIAPWFPAVNVALTGFHVLPDGAEVSPNRQFVGLKSNEKVVGQFYLPTRTREWIASLRTIKPIPASARGWGAYRAANCFAKRLSHTTLAAALREAARDWSGPIKTAGPLQIFWPLDACLAEACTPDELLLLADHAEAGRLGTFRDWDAAERRWGVNGLSVDDLGFRAGTELPIGSWIADRGFPLAAADLHALDSQANTLFLLLYRVFESLEGPDRRIMAGMCLRVLASLTRTMTSQKVQTRQIASVKVDVQPKQLIDLLEAAPLDPVPLAMFVLFDGQKGMREENQWIEFAEQLGKEGDGVERDMVLDFVRDRNWVLSWPGSSILLKAFEANPNRVGLFHVIAALAAVGAPVRVSGDAIEQYRSSNTINVWESLLLLDIAAGSWDHPTATRIAVVTANVVGRHHDPSGRLDFILLAIGKQVAANEERERLLLSIRRELLSRPDLSGLVRILVPHLLFQLGRHLSPLQDADRWRALGLPQLPAAPS